MTIEELMKKKGLSKSKLSQLSGIPYSTLSDIVSGKAEIKKCSAETVYKLAKYLGVSMEDILAPCCEKRLDFELFKSSICHRLKRLGDIQFLIDTIKKDDIRTYYDWEWFPESFYLLAMLDYISRLNNVPLCNRYDDLRCQKLSEPIYPSDVIAISLIMKNSDILEQAEREAIPEFKRFNIIEADIRNVA